MCCFIQNTLAQTLAEFEVKLEKDVLEPLNKLSEVTACASVPSFLIFHPRYSKALRT